jgi:hypothetical protein
VNGCRFSCAVRSKEAEYNARRHFQRKIIDRFDRSKGTGKMFRAYDRIRHVLLIPWPRVYEDDIPLVHVRLLL